MAVVVRGAGAGRNGRHGEVPRHPPRLRIHLLGHPHRRPDSRPQSPQKIGKLDAENCQQMALVSPCRRVLELIRGEIVVDGVVVVVVVVAVVGEERCERERISSAGRPRDGPAGPGADDVIAERSAVETPRSPPPFCHRSIARALISFNSIQLNSIQSDSFF